MHLDMHPDLVKALIRHKTCGMCQGPYEIPNQQRLADQLVSLTFVILPFCQALAQKAVIGCK